MKIKFVQTCLALVLVALLAFAVTAVQAAPASADVAQTALAVPAEQTVEEVGEALVALVLFGLTVYAVSLGAERTTEVVNVLLALLSKLPILKRLPTQGIWAWIYSGLVAAAGVFGFGIDIFAQVPLFADLDPQMVQMLGVLIVWIYSNFIHNSRVGSHVAAKLRA